MKFNLKFIIGAFAILYIFITLLFFNFYKELAIKDIKQEANSVLNYMNAVRSYINEVQRPVLYAEVNHHDEKEEYYDPRLFSSTFISQYIYDKQLYNKELKYTYKLVATNPLNPLYKANKEESKILDRFRKNEIKDYFSIIEDKNRSYFFIAKPIGRNVQSCMKCHGDPKDAPKRLVSTYGTSSGFHEKVGDLRAMIYLKIPVFDIIAYHKEEFITGGIAMFIVFVIFIILISKIYNKNKSLQDEKDRFIKQQNRTAVMGSMIGNISHQWKQPLTQLSYILINLELLNERKKLTDDKLLEKISEANGQITYMSNTIDDFKNFFSPKENVEDVPIVYILEQSVKLVQASLHKYEVNVRWNIKDNFTFYGSKNELIQVFVNIINNAKDSFISNNTSNRVINIECYFEGTNKIVTIENNGGNIDDKVINKIFKQYFSTKDLSVATGIGLYICKVIVESYDGSISVSNVNDGVKFKLSF